MKTIVKTCCLFIMVSIRINSFSQSVQCVITPSNNATTFEPGWTLKKDLNGDMVMLGKAPGLSGQMDAIQVSKIDMNCNVLWTLTYNFQGSDADESYDFDFDRSNNIFITGSTRNAHSNNVDIFLVKFSSAGVWQWESAYDGPDHLTDKAYSVVVGGDLVFVTGYSDLQNNITDGVTVAFDIGGSFHWYKNVTNSYNCVNYSICVDQYGHPYITGEEKSKSHRYSQIYTKSYDQGGNLIWTRFDQLQQFTTSGYNKPTKILADNTGLVVGATGYNDQNNTNDFFAFKYDFNGTPLWSNSFSFDLNGTDEKLNDILIDENNKAVYATGSVDVVNNNVTETDILTTSIDNGSGALKWFNQEVRNYTDESGVALDIDCNGDPYAASSTNDNQNANFGGYLVLRYLRGNGINNLTCYLGYQTTISVSDLVLISTDVFVTGTDWSLHSTVKFDSPAKCDQQRLANEPFQNYNQKLVLYPNPSSGVVNYNSDSDGIISIYDFQNRLIGNITIKAGENSLDLSKYESGIYNLIFRDNEGLNIVNEKIVLSH